MKPAERSAAIAHLRAIPCKQRDPGQEQLLESLLVADYRWRQRAARKVAAQLHPRNYRREARAAAYTGALAALRMMTLGEPA
jgi:hypothetical protein